MSSLTNKTISDAFQKLCKLTKKELILYILEIEEKNQENQEKKTEEEKEKKRIWKKKCESDERRKKKLIERAKKLSGKKLQLQEFAPYEEIADYGARIITATVSFDGDCFKIEGQNGTFVIKIVYSCRRGNNIMFSRTWSSSDRGWIVLDEHLWA